MSSLKYFVLGAIALATIVAGHPAYRKEFDRIVNGNDCLKTCMSNITAFDEEVSLMKNPDLQRYFGRLDDICDLIISTRQCIDDCKIESNPFALESINVVCQPDAREKVASINKCLNSEAAQTSIYQTCASTCGDYNEVNDQVHQLTQTIQESELKNDEKVNPIMEKTNLACGIFKCVTRCNVDAIKNQCGDDSARDLQALLQQVFDKQRSDIEKLNIVEAMSKNFPPQCSYMYDPTIIFGSDSATSEHSLDLSKPEDILPKIQLELMMKQLKLIERQDELITRENQKLNMEMQLLSQKAEQRKRGGYEESQFLFN